MERSSSSPIYIGMMMTNPRTDDATLRRYLQELGTSTPLTAGAELELGRSMRQARMELLKIFNAVPARHRNRILGELEGDDLTRDVAFEKLDAIVDRLIDAATEFTDERLTWLVSPAIAHRKQM